MTDDSKPPDDRKPPDNWKPEVWKSTISLADLVKRAKEREFERTKKISALEEERDSALRESADLARALSDTRNLQQHIDLASMEPGSTAPSSQNPIAANPSVVVSIPETVEIKFVDAGVLSDYEIYQTAASLLLTAVIAFFVAGVQEQDDKIGSIFFVFAGILSLLFAVAGFGAWKKRAKMYQKSRSRTYKLGEEVK